MYTVSKEKGFSIAALGRCVGESLYNFSLSIDKVKRAREVAGRNPFDSEALKRVMFKD